MNRTEPRTPLQALPPPPPGTPAGTKFSIREKWVKCGKDDCPCHKEGGKRHGPYLYRVWREGGKVRSQYLGRANKVPNKVPNTAPNKAPTGASLATLPAPVAVPPTAAPSVAIPKHPHRIGDKVRLRVKQAPAWYRRGCTNKLRKDQPEMVVDGIGWALLPTRGRVYAYVTLVLPAGEAVYHPYNAAFTGFDSGGLLDRRFPVELLQGRVSGRGAP